MAAFVTLLTDDPDAQEAALKKVADEQGIKRTPLTVFENNVGPSKYKIDENAEVTVIMWVESDVNQTFPSGPAVMATGPWSAFVGSV